MAKPSAHDIVLRFESKSRARFVAVSRTGIILARAPRGTWKRAGKVKPGVTAAQWIEILEQPKNAYRCTERCIDLAHVFISVAQGEARKRAAAKRRERDAAELALRTRGEDEARRGGLVAMAQFVADRLRKRLPAPLDGEMAFLYHLARFHGGSTGGNLATYHTAEWCLPEGTDAERRAALESWADQIARAVYGSDLVAAKLWAQALRGDS